MCVGQSFTKYDRLLVQGVSGLTKLYLLQSASGITNCDSYYKVLRSRVTGGSSYGLKGTEECPKN